MIADEMPSGVEHAARVALSCSDDGVIADEVPSGVEHVQRVASSPNGHRVFADEMPSGGASELVLRMM